MRTSLPLIILCALSAGAMAQPAAKPGATAAKPTATAKPGATKPGAAPSRALLDLATWLSEKSAGLAIKGRTYDPFLRVKDPTKIPPKPVPDPATLVANNNDPDETPRDPKLVFAEAVAAVKVVMVGGGQFGVDGGATLSEGETFVLGAGDNKFNTKVVSVGAKAIVLENTANGHRVKLPVGSTSGLPAGMTRGIPVAPFRPNSGN